MKNERKEHKKYGKFLTHTVDCAHADVDLFTEANRIYAVYNLDEDNEHSSSVSIDDILSNQYNYLFTPYINAIPFLLSK